MVAFGSVCLSETVASKSQSDLAEELLTFLIVLWNNPVMSSRILKKSIKGSLGHKSTGDAACMRHVSWYVCKA